MSDAISKAVELLSSAHVATDKFWERHDCVEGLKRFLKAMQGEAVGYYNPEVSNEELAFSFTYNADGYVPVYTAPQPVVPEGCVMVPKSALDGALYLAGLAVAHTNFDSQHRADFKVCCEALLSAGKGDV